MKTVTKLDTVVVYAILYLTRDHGGPRSGWENEMAEKNEKTCTLDEYWDAWENMVAVFVDAVGEEQARRIDLINVNGRPVPDTRNVGDGRDIVNTGVNWAGCGTMSVDEAKEFSFALQTAIFVASCFKYNGYRVVRG